MSFIILLLLFSFCIIKAPAEFSCSSFSPASDNANLTLFDLSSSPFTAPFDELEYIDSPPSLAFILVRSPPPQPPPQHSPSSSMQSIQIDFIPPPQCFSHKLLNVCNSLPLQIQVPTNSCSYDRDPNDSHKTQLDLSVTHDTNAAAYHVQVNYTGRHEINMTFTLSATDLLRDDYSRGDDSNISLFIGYITNIGGDDSNITCLFFGYITNIGGPSAQAPTDDKSNHIKVVLWVVLGVSMMIFVMGLIIVVLSLAKRRGRPSLVSARPAGRVDPSSTTSRAPFPHHRLESSEAPMMHALPPSPPYTNDFHISGTASWLNQPNPR